MIIYDKVGDTCFLIETTDYELGGYPDYSGGDGLRHTQTTSIRDEAGNKMGEAIHLLRNIADGVNHEFSRTNTMPEAIEIELGLSLSTELKLWAVGAGSSTTLKVKLVWKNQHLLS